jgi:hypothetical protein
LEAAEELFELDLERREESEERKMREKLRKSKRDCLLS